VNPEEIVIPSEIRPDDGRFGSGPAKVRPESVAALQRAASSYLGTSHRQAGVRSIVARLKDGLRTLFSLPEDYEVLLGNGGTTAFWDAQVFALIERRSRHYVFGEFSSKFAEAVAAATHIDDPEILESEPGTHPVAGQSENVDLYAFTHNETSTGVSMPVTRLPGALVSVDATSAAGALRVDAHDFDAYYFAPQKAFSSDGGLWIALCSPAALDRIETISGSDRYIPPSLDLSIARSNSAKDQTYNTPALATLFLMVEQIDWMLDQGGLEWSAARCHRSADIIYSWAEACDVAWPFVKDSAQRSHTVATIDFADQVDAKALAAALRANGILDTEPYRKLGRNQLRIAMYPAIEPSDLEALTKCIDYLLSQME
jgi:phosphoserine aminotransferase